MLQSRRGWALCGPSDGRGACPEWFPNWQGKTCAVVGCGPSLTRADVARLEGRCAVLVINRAHELAPWADALYACDGKFWTQYPQALAFAGLKITQDERAAQEFGLHRVTLVQSVSDEAGLIGGGGNSGFQAVNLAMQFRASRIVLLGFDMSTDEGRHWHEDHRSPLCNPHRWGAAEWRKTFDAAAPLYAARGVEIINCSRRTALTCFQTMDLERAL